jgi:hypothetical protein
MPPVDTEPTPNALDEGAPVRLIARTILVDDLEGVIDVLDTHLGWVPNTVRSGSDGVRRACFEFAYPGSAILEVIQPSKPGVEADLLAAWGPGPFSVRIAVNGLDLLRNRFRSKDIPHLDLPPVAGTTSPRLYRPPIFELGTAFEFIDA